MRVLHVTETYLPQLGGIEIHVDDLVCRHQAHGHQAEIVTSTRPAGPGSADPAWVRRLGGRALTAPGRTVLAAREISALIAATDPDVVHAHASVVSPLAMAAARAGGASRRPTVLTVHSLWNRLGPVPTLVESTLQLRRWPVVWSSVSAVAAESVARTMGGTSAWRRSRTVWTLASGARPGLHRPVSSRSSA